MSQQHVTMSTHPRFVLLEPRQTPARTGELFQIVCPPNGRARQLLRSALSSPVIAVDFETKGNDYSNSPDTDCVVGIGLAWEGGSCYLSVTDSHYDDEVWSLVEQILTQHEGLLAHNVYYDGGWVKRDFGQHSKWLACTYGMYMQIASEGWAGQKWSLKNAMQDVLLWSDTNEEQLDQWLVDNGYKKQNNAPLKGEMWRAPPSILGQYCVLDAEATYLLYTEHFVPVLKRFPALASYHKEDFLPHVMTHIDQKILGIMVNRPHWEGYRTELQEKIDSFNDDFRSHPLVKDYIEEWTTTKYQEFLQTEPERYIKEKVRKEPPKYLKDGKTLSKNWLKWSALQIIPRRETVHWLKWKEKEVLVKEGKHPLSEFNIQSGDHLRWLLYDKLQYEVILLTDKGQPAVGKDALGGMGTVGKLLNSRSKLVKEATYLDDYLMRTRHKNTIHPSFRMPGTVTGRLSGSEPNVQQVPKNIGTLSGFIARPGHVFVDCDVNALEMVVTAELSQDKNLLALYGPNAKQNDLYLFFGSMMSVIGPKIRASGYDPYNPTPDSIDKAKKECKKERSIAKLLILSDNYGSGIGKKQQILRLSGVDITLNEVRDMHESLQQGKEGVLQYVAWLQGTWRKNNGWVENAYGRPICIDKTREKDLLNAVVQSSGHDILQLYSRLAKEVLNEAGIPWSPIIMDWHDEIIVEVPEEFGKVTFDLLEKETYRRLNNVLQGTCPLSGAAALGKTLADIKLEG